MDNWTNFYHPPTVDLPVGVYYVNPEQLREKVRIHYRHPEVEIAMIHRGSLQMQIGDQELLLQPGDIAISNPYEVHGYRSLTTQVQEITLRFSLDLLALPEEIFFRREFVEPLRNGQIRLPRLLTPDHPAHRAVYDALCQLHPQKEGQPGYRQTLMLVVFQICGALMTSCIPEPRKESDNSMVNSCMQFINEHYGEKLTLQRIADHVGLHPNYLCNRFKEVSGQTVFHYMTGIRIEEAWRLLKSSELSPGQICQVCGFNNMAYFNRKFKERYDMTPKQYQKRFNRKK